MPSKVWFLGAVSFLWLMLAAVLPIGGPNGWVLASIENGKPGGALPGRVLWASLVKGKIEGQQMLPPGEVVLDYHPQSKQLLTHSTVEEQGKIGGVQVLTVWKVAPTDTSVTLVARWRADSNEGGGAPSTWGRIVDASTVIQRWKRNEYAAWDIAGKRLKYRLPQESFFVPDPTLSGGRRYLIVPEDRQVRIVESVSFTPFISSIRIQSGQKIAWQSGTATGAPPVMSLRNGQTAQGEVDQWQKPNVEFFERLDVPAKILDPDKQNGLGVTQVTNRGLIAKE